MEFWDAATDTQRAIVVLSALAVLVPAGFAYWMNQENKQRHDEVMAAEQDRHAEVLRAEVARHQSDKAHRENERHTLAHGEARDVVTKSNLEYDASTGRFEIEAWMQAPKRIDNVRLTVEFNFPWHHRFSEDSGDDLIERWCGSPEPGQEVQVTSVAGIHTEPWPDYPFELKYDWSMTWEDRFRYRWVRRREDGETKWLK